MKKFLSLFIATAIVFCSFGITISADKQNLLYGDVNLDQKINNKDAGILIQYINNWSVNIDKQNADVNIDDKINNKDYGLIMQYVNNWDVKLGEKQDDSSDPNDYWGTEITFATTVLSNYDEAGPVIYNFEKEYGINVNEILVTHNIIEIAGKIASGINIDLMRCNGEFPAALSVLQPLDAAKLDYHDPIWNQNTFKMTTFGGSPYLCNTIGNIWEESDCVIYSKKLLRQAQCYTPEEYDALGKWTWDAFFDIAKYVDRIDGPGGIRGCYYSIETMLGSAGCGLYNYKNGLFTNGLENNLHKEAIIRLADFYADEGYVTTAASTPFTSGKVGICTGMAWSLKKTGPNKVYDWDDIGFYYLPSYKQGEKANSTGMLRGWGICRGADNPEAAGIFLKYYLDVNNYDVGGTFITPAAETFFFMLTNIDYYHYTPYFTYGDSNYDLTGFNEWDWENLTRSPVEWINRDYPAISSSVDKACQNLNNFIDKNT